MMEKSIRKAEELFDEVGIDLSSIKHYSFADYGITDAYYVRYKNQTANKSHASVVDWTDKILGEYKKESGGYKKDYAISWSEYARQTGDLEKHGLDGYALPALPKKKGRLIDATAGAIVFADKKDYYVAYKIAYTPYVVVRRVSRHYLGEGVLGRAFPFAKLIEIAADLYGDQFTEVLLHELNHVRFPEDPESRTRDRTRGDLARLGLYNHFHKK